MTGPAPNTPVGEPGKPRVETKVTAATILAAGTSVTLAILNAVTDSALLGVAPGWLQFVAVAVVPPLLTGLAGYQAPHTPRPPLVSPVHD